MHRQVPASSCSSPNEMIAEGGPRGPSANGKRVVPPEGIRMTTIGAVVEAATHAAMKVSRTRAEGYELASLAVENILRRAA